MQQSSTINELAKALVTFQIKVDSIKKDAKNPFFKSTYASLSNILDAIKEPLCECGLSLSQFPEGEYELTTRILHESGEWMEASYTMKPVKDDPQGRGSCITYQRRYAIAAILSLNIDEDDDGNHATYPSGKVEKQQKQDDRNDDRKWLNKGTKDWDNAMKKLEKGEVTIDKICEFYKVSTATRQEMLEYDKSWRSK
jgi:hypothetical protein